MCTPEQGEHDSDNCLHERSAADPKSLSFFAFRTEPMSASGNVTLDELATIAGPHGAVLVDAEGRVRLVDRLHPERELSPQRSYLDRIRGAQPL